jgi:acyl-coenzyme A thioesterase PaaI-like protein
MKFLFNLIDKLIANPSQVNLLALNRVLTFGIPFNAPHGFKIRQIDDEAVVISLPNRRLNHNHLGGVHACAMATVGEYCAGMSLLKTFGISRYRLILADLHVKYTYQGRTDLEGRCSTRQISRDDVLHGLEREGKYLQTLITLIQDNNGREVATVTTTWQLKPWDKVRTKG